MIEDNLSVSIDELRASLVDEIIKSVGLPRTPFWRKVFFPFSGCLLTGCHVLERILTHWFQKVDFTARCGTCRPFLSVM